MCLIVICIIWSCSMFHICSQYDPFPYIFLMVIFLVKKRFQLILVRHFWLSKRTKKRITQMRSKTINEKTRNFKHLDYTTTPFLHPCVLLDAAAAKRFVIPICRHFFLFFFFFSAHKSPPRRLSFSFHHHCAPATLPSSSLILAWRSATCRFKAEFSALSCSLAAADVPRNCLIKSTGSAGLSVSSYRPTNPDDDGGMAPSCQHEGWRSEKGKKSHLL